MADQNIKVKIDLDVSEFNKNVKAMSDALSKILGKDVDIFNGKIKQTTTNVDQATDAMNKATNAANKTSDSIKKSNQQWTNLSLVVQDLPFGFRGIQNNLPALAAGFAGVTGPIYLAVSALIAIWTAFGDEITKVIFKTAEATSQNKLVSDSFKSVESSVVQASVSVDKMNFMIDQAKQGFVSKDKVVKTYNETLGKTIGQQTTFNGVVDAMKSKGEKYIELVTMMSFANALAAQSAKEAFTALMAEVKSPEEALGSIQKFGKGALSSVEYLINSIRGKTGELTPISDALYGAVGTVEKGKEVNAANKSVKFLDGFLKNVKTEISKFAKENNFNLFDFGNDNAKPKVNTRLLDVLKSQAKLYEDDLFTKRYYNLLILDEEEKVALEQAKIDKASKDDLALIAEDFKNKRLLIEKQTQDAIQIIRNQNAKNEGEFYAKQLEDYKKTQEKITKEGIYFTQQRIKELKTEENASIRANKGNYDAQKAAIEQTIVKLGVLRMAGIGGAAAMMDLNEAIAANKAQLEGLVDPLENFNNSLNDIIRKTLENMAIALGESLGKMLSGGGGGIKELMNNFLGIMADGLIQIGKLAIQTGIAVLGIKEALKTLNPYVAIAAGIALVALGTYVKGRLSNSADSMGGTKKFANGGIISGPTMGLMGEYPGASHNPEVVAPLDKLKSLIGGSGGGTLEARISGNDLLILMNKAGRNNNNTF